MWLSKIISPIAGLIRLLRPSVAVSGEASVPGASSSASSYHSVQIPTAKIMQESAHRTMVVVSDDSRPVLQKLPSVGKQAEMREICQTFETGSERGRMLQRRWTISFVRDEAASFKAGLEELQRKLERYAALPESDLPEIRRQRAILGDQLAFQHEKLKRSWYLRNEKILCALFLEGDEFLKYFDETVLGWIKKLPDNMQTHLAPVHRYEATANRKGPDRTRERIELGREVLQLYLDADRLRHLCAEEIAKSAEEIDDASFLDFFDVGQSSGYLGGYMVKVSSLLQSSRVRGRDKALEALCRDPVWGEEAAFFRQRLIDLEEDVRKFREIRYSKNGEDLSEKVRMGRAIVRQYKEIERSWFYQRLLVSYDAKTALLHKENDLLQLETVLSAMQVDSDLNDRLFGKIERPLFRYDIRFRLPEETADGILFQSPSAEGRDLISLMVASVEVCVSDLKAVRKLVVSLAQQGLLSQEEAEAVLKKLNGEKSSLELSVGQAEIPLKIMIDHAVEIISEAVRLSETEWKLVEAVLEEIHPLLGAGKEMEELKKRLRSDLYAFLKAKMEEFQFDSLDDVRPFEKQVLKEWMRDYALKDFEKPDSFTNTPATSSRSA